MSQRDCSKREIGSNFKILSVGPEIEVHHSVKISIGNDTKLYDNDNKTMLYGDMGKSWIIIKQRRKYNSPDEGNIKDTVISVNSMPQFTGVLQDAEEWLFADKLRDKVYNYDAYNNLVGLLDPPRKIKLPLARGTKFFAMSPSIINDSTGVKRESITLFNEGGVIGRASANEFFSFVYHVTNLCNTYFVSTHSALQTALLLDIISNGGKS